MYERAEAGGAEYQGDADRKLDKGRRKVRLLVQGERLGKRLTIAG